MSKTVEIKIDDRVYNAAIVTSKKAYHLSVELNEIVKVNAEIARLRPLSEGEQPYTEEDLLGAKDDLRLKLVASLELEKRSLV